MFQTFQIWLDRWTPHTASRWTFTVVLVVGFLIRIVITQVSESSIWLFLVFQMYQKALDESTQFTRGRWIAFVALNVCFLLRIVLKQACSVCANKRQLPSF